MDPQYKNGLPILFFQNQLSFEDWLRVHQDELGVLIKLAKKGSGFKSISYDEAVESALCFGWIDSQANSLDTQFYLQKFSPRRSKSKWSRLNCEKAEALISLGRMQPAGLHQVELARLDGRWEAAYDSPTTITIPADLQQALDDNPKAREFFTSLDSQNRYAILHRLQLTRKPDARLAKIDKFIEMLSKHEKIYP